MPITQSAKKALRQNVTHRKRNVEKMRAMREAIKKFKKSPSSEGLVLVMKTLDKAAQGNVIKKNKASRLKSRLSHLIAKPK